MESFYQRAYARTDLSALLALASNNAKARLPNTSYLLGSDINWQLPGSDPKNNIRLWFSGCEHECETELVAFAWFQAGSVMPFDIHHDIANKAALIQDVTGWLESKTSQHQKSHPWLLNLKNMTEWQAALASREHLKSAPQHSVQVSCLDKDIGRRDALLDLGYKTTDHFEYSLLQTLSGREAPSESESKYLVRPVLPNELAARVQVHRDAWFKSSYSLQQYQALRLMPEYRDDLDVVLCDEKGELMACCIGWVDAQASVGSIEPLGVSEKFRGVGAAKLLVSYLLSSFKDEGVQWAKLGTAGFNEPAYRLYSSCGYELADFDRTYIKYL